MDRWWAAAAIVSGLAWRGRPGHPRRCPPRRASGVSVKVTPDHGLVAGQTVTITRPGLARTAGGKPLTWFVAECTAAVRAAWTPPPTRRIATSPTAAGDPGPPQRHLHRPLPRRDRHHRRRLLRDAGPHRLRHRRRERPGPGHRREHHLQERHPGDVGSHHVDHLLTATS